MERDGEDGGGRVSLGDVHAVRYRGGRTVMMSTVTALTRAREHVWRVAVVLVNTWEKGEGERRAESMAFDDALSCPGRVHARPGTFWASWVQSSLGCVLLSSTKGMYQRV
jgi:hypothetical protein